ATQLGMGYQSGLAWSPDGKILAVGGSVGVWFYDTATWELLPQRLLAKKVNHIAFMPDGTAIATYSEDGTVLICDVQQSILKVTLRTEESVDYYYGGLAFSPDGDILATAGTSGYVRLWRTTDGELSTTWTNPNPGFNLSFAHNGSLLAIGTEDGTIHLW